MKRFNDATGKQWEFEVDLVSIERVKDDTGVDLTLLFDDEMKSLAAVTGNPAQLAAVLWSLIRNPDWLPEVCKGRKLEFLKALRGDALEAGAKALMDGVIDFFPSERRRALLREAVAKMWGIQTSLIGLS